MAEPHEIVSPNDSGSETLARFAYQAHATFPYLLELVRGEDVLAVFAEHVEDIAVQERDSWRFLQVKTRDPGRGPWTLTAVIEAHAIRSLWRAYRSAGRSVDATYELLLEGAVLNSDVLAEVGAEKELDDDFLERLSRACPDGVEEIHDFAARLRVRELPPLGSIISDNVRLLIDVAPSLPAGEIRKVYKTAVEAIEESMKAGRLEDNWPAALFLDADQRSRQRLTAKRFDRETVEGLLAPVLANRGLPHPPPPSVVAAPVLSVPFILPQRDVETFTGRSEELERLEFLLLRDAGEKVSSIAGVSGAGGIGKSALACHFAELHRDAFPGGVIGLRVDGREPISIARYFAARVSVEFDADDERDASTIMQEVFRDRRALLIFDNAEDVSIRRLLPGGGRCAVIITTRDRGLPVSLGIPAAARLDLTPLLPEDARKLLEELVGECATADPDAAARVCTLVGNLPLAIQIAGATLQNEPWRALDHYAEALREEKQRLSLLSVPGDSDLSVRASFSLSLRLLAPEEIDFFGSLSVCAQDGFSAMSAAAANGCDEPAAYESLARLYGRSLVNRSASGEARFVLHPLIRLYARETADARGVLTAAGKRHRDFYAALVTEKAHHAAGPEAAALLGREIDDIVAAAESMASSGTLDYDFVLRLEPFFQREGYWEKAESIFAAFLSGAEQANDRSAIVQLRLQQGKFLTLRGDLAQAQATLESLAPLVSLLESEGGRKRAEAMRLNSLGVVLRRQGRFEEAAGHFARSGAIDEALGNLRGQAMALNSLGGALQRKASYAEAAEMFRRSATIDAALDNRRGQAISLNSLGVVLQRLGEFDAAIEVLRESQALVEAIGDLPGQAMVLNSLGNARQAKGDFAGAAGMFRRSAAIDQKLGNRRGEAMALNSLGVVLQRQGKLGVAADALRRSASIESRLGNERGEATVLNSLGGVLQRQGKFDEAIATFRRGQAISEKLDDQRSLAMVLNSLGGVLQRQGKLDEAAGVFRRSVAIGEYIKDTRHLAMVLNSLGGVLQRQDQLDEAVDMFRRSLEISEELRDEVSVAMRLNSLGGVLQRQGKLDDAAATFRRSLAISEKTQDQRSLGMVLNSLGGVLQRQKKLEEAIVVLRRSQAISEKLDDQRSLAMVLNSLGGALQRQGNHEEAFEAFRKSIAIGESLGDERHLAMVHTAYGRALLPTDRPAAVVELRKGFELDAALPNRKGIGIVAPILVETLVKLGRIHQAVEICDRALSIIPRDAKLLQLKRDLSGRRAS